MSKVIKIVILSILAVLLTVFMIVVINGKDTYYLNLIDYSSELILDKEFKGEDINSFNIESDSSDISIKKTDSDVVSVKIYGDKTNEVSAIVKDNTLYVEKDKDITICLFFCMMDSKIEILVPELEYNNLKIGIASGDIDIEGIKFKNADLDLVSGDVNFDKIETGKIITVSGNIIGNIINDINARTISGDIKISNINKSCNLSTTSGNIWISDLNMLTSSSLKTISGDVRILKVNDIYFDISTISGNVDAEKNNRFSEKELKVSTTSGNVYINN